MGWWHSNKEHWSLLWVLMEGWPRVVGSISERPCHAVTISGFFWSAKFFQIRSAPSSGETRERERYRVREREKGKKMQRGVNAEAGCSCTDTSILFVIFMHFKVLNCVDENPEPRLFHTYTVSWLSTHTPQKKTECVTPSGILKGSVPVSISPERNNEAKPLRLKHGKDTKIKHVRALLWGSYYRP